MKRLLPILLLFTLSPFHPFTISAAEVTIYPYTGQSVDGKPLVIQTFVPLDSIARQKKWTFPSANYEKRTVWNIPLDNPNQILEAWIDLNGNGSHDVDEPYGTSAMRDYPEIELSDHSAIAPRINLVGDTSDQLVTRDQVIAEAIGRVSMSFRTGLTNNVIADAAVADNDFRGRRVRVVRWLVNGFPLYAVDVPPRVIFDKKIESDTRKVVTEEDILADSQAFDLDWADLKREVVDNPRVDLTFGSVTDVSYLVVVGDGPIGWDSVGDTNSVVTALKTAIVRRFGETRVLPQPVEPKVRGDAVTLGWKMDKEFNDIGYYGIYRYQDPGCSYTGFRAKVMSGTNEVVDTGIQRMPARTAEYTYHYTITNRLPAGTYSWKISAYNSKYSEEDSQSYTNGIPFTIE